MPEPTEHTPEVELTTLRKVREELLTKSHAQKARIAELETAALQLTERADKATALMRTAVVDQPLKRMVAALSPTVPELVMRELLADYTFDAGDDGAIIISTKADGKPIAAKDGKPVEWDKHSLHQFLIGNGYAEKNDRQRVYAHLLGIPSASGGVGRKVPALPRPGASSDEKIEASLSFGLR